MVSKTKRPPGIPAGVLVLVEVECRLGAAALDQHAQAEETHEGHGELWDSNQGVLCFDVFKNNT